jgi:hypothetical protein
MSVSTLVNVLLVMLVISPDTLPSEMPEPALLIVLPSIESSASFGFSTLIPVRTSRMVLSSMMVWTAPPSDHTARPQAAVPYLPKLCSGSPWNRLSEIVTVPLASPWTLMATS